MQKKSRSKSFFKAFIFLSFYTTSLFAETTVYNEDQLESAIGSTDNIKFGADITLSKPLPLIMNKSYTIDGDNYFLDGANTYRGLIFVSSSTATVQNLTIQNCKAKGGDSLPPSTNESGSGGGGLGAGGALFIGDGSEITAINVTYTSNNATGGNSASPAAQPSGDSGGSGGGGLGGDGGAAITDDGGGGGGILQGEDALGNTKGGTTPYAGGQGALETGTNATAPGYGGGGGGAAPVSNARSTWGNIGGGGGGGGSGSQGLLENNGGGTSFGGGTGGGGKNGNSATASGLSGAGANGNGTIGGQGGGGGAGGGAIFIDRYSALTISDSTYNFSSNSITAGTGANNGTAKGVDIFMEDGADLTLKSTGNMNVTQSIESMESYRNNGGLTVTGGGIVNFSVTPNHEGFFKLIDGTVQFANNVDGFSIAQFGDGGSPGNRVCEYTGTFARGFYVPVSVLDPTTFRTSTGTYNYTSYWSGSGPITIEGKIQLNTSSSSLSSDFLINSGSLRASSNNCLGSGAGTVELNGGKLQLDNVTVSNKIKVSSASIIERSSTGTASLTGVLEGSADLSLRSIITTNILNLNNSSITLTGDISVNHYVNVILSYAGGLTTPSSLSVTDFATFKIPNTITSDIAIPTLSGDGNGSIILDQSDSNNLVIKQNSPGTFSGIISGSGSIEKDGNATLNIFGNNTYTGDTTITAGTLSINSASSLSSGASNIDFNGGTLLTTQDMTLTNTVDFSSDSVLDTSSNTLTYQGTASGSARLTKVGSGTLIIDSATNTPLGVTTLNAGTLTSNASSVWGPVTLNSNTLVKGTGTIGTTNNTNGTITPGFSIGTINIAGDYNQGAGGTLEIEIDHTGASDKLVITGTANLNGTLNVVPLTDSALYLEGTQYTILTAAAVSGTFSRVTDPDEFLVFSVDYLPLGDPPRVILTLLDSTLILPINQLSNKNAIATANYLGGLNLDNTDFVDILTNLAVLNIEDMTDALLQISPLRFASLHYTDANTAAIVSKILSDRQAFLYRCKKECIKDDKMPCIKAKTFDVWVEPFAYFNYQQTLEDLPSYKNSTYGSILGFDYNFLENISFGSAAGYSYVDLDFTKNLGKSDINSAYLSFYSNAYYKFFFSNLSISSAYNHYKVKRKIAYTGVEKEAVHSHDGFEITGHFNFGLNLNAVQPQVYFDYINSFHKGFSEKGADSLNLKVNSSHFSSLRSAYIMNFIKDYKYKDYCLSPSFRLGWIHDIRLSSNELKSRLFTLSPSDNTFEVFSRQNKNFALIGISFSTIKSTGFSTLWNYQLELGEGLEKHIGTLRLNWNF